MVEVYAQVVSRTDCRGKAQVVPYIVLCHPGVASLTVLTIVGLKHAKAWTVLTVLGVVHLSGRSKYFFSGSRSVTHAPYYRGPLRDHIGRRRAHVVRMTCAHRHVRCSPRAWGPHRATQTPARPGGHRGAT